MKLGFVILTALVYVASATASRSGQPTVGVGSPEGTVPGLSTGGTGSPFIPAPGPRPSIEQCATAWNAGAPKTTERWLVARRLSGATVGVGSQGVSRTNPQFGPICSLTFYAKSGDAILISGVWKNGGVPAWRGVVGPHLGAVIAGNASVARDGTLHLR